MNFPTYRYQAELGGGLVFASTVRDPRGLTVNLGDSHGSSCLPGCYNGRILNLYPIVALIPALSAKSMKTLADDFTLGGASGK